MYNLCIGGQDQEPSGDYEVLGRVAYSGRVRQVVRPALEAVHRGTGGLVSELKAVYIYHVNMHTVIYCHIRMYYICLLILLYMLCVYR